MSDKITVVNVSNMGITVKAADGDEITLTAYSEHSIDAKFGWNLPNQIKVKKAAVVATDNTAVVANNTADSE